MAGPLSRYIQSLPSGSSLALSGAHTAELLGVYTELLAAGAIVAFELLLL